MVARAAARRLALTAVESGPFSRTLDALERVDPGAGCLTVLTYHRVDDRWGRPDLDPALVSASPWEFERHVAYLARTRRVLSLDDLLAIRRGEAPIPARAVMVTFDDAYRDFAQRAWPVLRRHGLPVTLFVPTAYPDHPERVFWWDRLHRLVDGARSAGTLRTPLGTLPTATPAERHVALDALRGWVPQRPHDEALEAITAMEAAAPAGTGTVPPPAVLGWEELRALAAEGVTLAAHTRTHPCLDRLPLEEARAEVLDSLADLERGTGAPAARVVAFPGGRTTEALVGALAGDGLEAAFTTARGANRLRGVRWLRLRRINVGRRTSVRVLRAQLLSFAPAAPALPRTGA
jgi:peptidoglycan/xylan/chitin deacetylase (PgdA/CDA1 family)